AVGGARAGTRAAVRAGAGRDRGRVVFRQELPEERRDPDRRLHPGLRLLGRAAGVVSDSRGAGGTTGGLHDVDLESWLEAALASNAGRLLGRGYQGSVRLLASPRGEVVVKSMHEYPLLKPVGRRALRREAAVYERLRGIPGIPESYGLVQGHLVLEHVVGPSLRQREHDLSDREAFFRRLLETLEAMHEAGVAHGD